MAACEETLDSCNALCVRLPVPGPSVFCPRDPRWGTKPRGAQRRGSRRKDGDSCTRSAQAPGVAVPQRRRGPIPPLPPRPSRARGLGARLRPPSYGFKRSSGRAAGRVGGRRGPGRVLARPRNHAGALRRARARGPARPAGRRAAGEEPRTLAGEFPGRRSGRCGETVRQEGALSGACVIAAN